MPSLTVRGLWCSTLVPEQPLLVVALLVVFIQRKSNLWTTGLPRLTEGWLVCWPALNKLWFPSSINVILYVSGGTDYLYHPLVFPALDRSNLTEAVRSDLFNVYWMFTGVDSKLTQTAYYNSTNNMSEWTHSWVLPSEIIRDLLLDHFSLASNFLFIINSGYLQFYSSTILFSYYPKQQISESRNSI